MSSRRSDITRAAEGTCAWLIRHETYQRWAVSDRALLWIKGKPAISGQFRRLGVVELAVPGPGRSRRLMELNSGGDPFLR